MTVSSALNRKTYAGNGSTTVFATSPMVFFDDSDLEVYFVVTATGTTTLKTITTHYAVTGGDGAVGTVTMTSSAIPPTGTNLLILRVMPLTQGSDFVNNDPSDAEVAEDALDKLTMLTQQLDEAVGRSISLPVGSALTDLSMPDPTNKAGYVLVANADEDGFELLLSADVDLTTVTAYAATILDDTTAAAARATLGSTTVGDAVFIATNAAAARSTLGSTTVGDAVFIATNAAAGRSALGALASSVGTTKGDVIGYSASDTPARLAVGTDGYPLVPLSGATLGLAYLAPGIHILNGSLAASVASNALTISLVTAAGGAPSATDPVFIAFRSATATDGTYTLVKVTAATTLVVSSGSTLGTVSGVPHRLWVTVFNDAGTVRLGVINTQANGTGGGIYPLSDDMLASSTAEGGGGAADSAGVLYSGTAVTTKATRVAGYIESSQTTAGTWATAVTKIQSWSPGMKLPGDSVQSFYTSTGAVITTSTALPMDDTIPQSTEGVELLTQAITPQSTINALEIAAGSTGGKDGAADAMLLALFQDSTANALSAIGSDMYAGTAFAAVSLRHRMRSATTSATTFKLRGGSSGAAATTINGRNTGRIFGGVMNTYLRVAEIMV